MIGNWFLLECHFGRKVWRTMTLTVRQAVLSDLDALAPLFDGYRQFYGGASDLAAAHAFLLARFNHGESVVFIAFADTAAIGFTQLYPSFSSISMARIFMLNDLFVVAHYRKHGAGSKLLTAAIKHGHTFGAVQLVLSTATTNHTAQSVYEAGGWVRDTQYYVYEYNIKPDDSYMS